MPLKKQILVIEDHPEYQEALAMILRRKLDLDIVGEFALAEHALEFLDNRDKQPEPDLILLDLNLPSQSGLEALPLLLQKAPSTKVIILTQSEHETDVLEALKKGAAGYLLKSSTAQQIVDSIESVLRGGAALDARVANSVLTAIRQNQAPPDAPTPLSQRETQVLTLMAQGRSKKEIALELNLKTPTIVSHVTNIYRKLDANNAPAAIANAFQKGILKQEP